MDKVYTIGRGPDCQIQIHDPSQKVSRLHATLKMQSRKKIFIIDQSSNGTWVNGVKIMRNVDYPVKKGDTISFANTIDLDWSEIPDTNKNRILYLNLIIISVLIIATGTWYYVLRKAASGNTETQETLSPREKTNPSADTISGQKNDTTPEVQPENKSLKEDSQTDSPATKKTEKTAKPDPEKGKESKKDSLKKTIII